MVAGDAHSARLKICVAHGWIGYMSGQYMDNTTSPQWLPLDLGASSNIGICWFLVTFFTHFSTLTPKIMPKRFTKNQCGLIFWKPICFSLSVVNTKFLGITMMENWALVLIVAKTGEKITYFSVNSAWKGLNSSDSWILYCIRPSKKNTLFLVISKIVYHFQQ